MNKNAPNDFLGTENWIFAVSAVNFAYSLKFMVIQECVSMRT